MSNIKNYINIDKNCGLSELPNCVHILEEGCKIERIGGWNTNLKHAPEYERVLVTVKSGCVFIAQRHVFSDWLIYVDDKKVKLKTIDPVVAWMRLPAAYKQDGGVL